MWTIPLLVVIAVIVAIYFTYGFVAGLRIDTSNMTGLEVLKLLGRNTLKGFFASKND